MRKFAHFIYVFVLVLLVIGAIQKWTYFPNQLIVLAGALIIYNLIVNIHFLVLNLRLKQGFLYYLLYIIGYMAIFSFLFLYLLKDLDYYFINVANWGTIISASISVLFFMYLFFIDSPIRKYRRYFVGGFLLLCVLLQLNLPIIKQLPDRFFNPEVEEPAYPKGKGSVIYIDQGHHNFHTLEDRLISTARLLREDGYIIEPYSGSFETKKLDECKILMIINPLHESNTMGRWYKPISSAFTNEEIIVVEKWVKDGGSLLLVADHFPIPGAAETLAYTFGFILENGHASDTIGLKDYFSRDNSMLKSTIITDGLKSSEKVDSIMTFGGHAFSIPDDAISFMTFNHNYVQWNVVAAFNFEGITPFSIEGYSQGAYKKHGKGRIVVLGEAMMMTAQLGGGLSMIKLGMNSPQAPYNYQLLLNIIHWLDGKLEE